MLDPWHDINEGKSRKDFPLTLKLLDCAGADPLSWEEFNGILGRGSPQNPALKYKPVQGEILNGKIVLRRRLI